MKVVMSLAVLVTATTALGQIRPDECGRPGHRLNTEFQRTTGERVTQSFRRSGNANIPTEASFNGQLRARTFLNFVDTVCNQRPYSYPQRVCHEVAPEIALGRGNQLLQSFYDLRVSRRERALQFSRSVRFSLNAHQAERLEMAAQILDHLTTVAVNAGLPRSWAEFTAVLDQGVATSMLSLHLVEEITRINMIPNRQALGFAPMEGAVVREGRGNGSLNAAFDLRATPEARAQHLTRLLDGVTLRIARELSSAFIDYVRTRPIPQNWDQFVVMMRHAHALAAIGDLEFRRIVIDNEYSNRIKLGFELTAEHCRTETITRVYNAVERVNRTEPGEVVTRRFEVKVSNAPLLTGEEEQFNVSFDGIGNLGLSRPENFNAYQVNMSEEGDLVRFTAVGSRKAITPTNTIQASWRKAGDENIMTLQNNGYNPQMGGRVLVQVRYMNSRFLRRNQAMATETYELKDGAPVTITAQLKNKNVDYVLVSMQIVGSPFYSSAHTSEVKITR
jgi:hypothetical protein